MRKSQHYHVQKVLSKVPKANAVSINRAVRVGKLFIVIPQTATRRTHDQLITTLIPQKSLPQSSSEIKEPAKQSVAHKLLKFDERGPQARGS